MNILFVLDGDFRRSRISPLLRFARAFHLLGHSCAMAMPSSVDTVFQDERNAIRPILYGDALAKPKSVFADGCAADVIHAYSTGDLVERFVSSYMAQQPTPLIVHLEDSMACIAKRGDSLIGLADAAVIVQDNLKLFIPPWVYCSTGMIGVDLELFSPRPPEPCIRARYGVSETERVIVYHGELNGSVKSPLESLCKAVGLVNQRGYRCRLLKAGPFALDFLKRLPPQTVSLITDLGVMPEHELPDLFALADVFVHPGQIGSSEDLKLSATVPEFFAMGRPVVMPDVNMHHLIRDGSNAVFLHTGSAEEIAATCIDLFCDSQRADAIGRAGRRLAEQCFDVTTQARRLEDLYKTASNRFNPAVASEIWGGKDENPPLALLLAHKLRLLAASANTISELDASDILKDYARYIEFMYQRLTGLKRDISKRDGRLADLHRKVADLDKQLTDPHQRIAERDRELASLLGSRSMRLTAPLRYVGQRWRRARQALWIFSAVVSQSGGLMNIMHKGIAVYRHEGLADVLNRMRNRILGSGIIAVLQGGQLDPVFTNRHDYAEWIRRYDTVTDENRLAMRHRIGTMTHTPLISVVMPTFNPGPEWLIKAIESVRGQIYPHWELCIADDASSDKTIRPILERYAKEEPRIKVVFREYNGHISVASNDALTLVTGEWVALLDHDDLLAEHAFFWVADAINQNPKVRLIYSDEDKIDEKDRRFDPYFKCDWNVDLFYSHNLITHLGMYRTDLLRKIGGFRQGFEGAQDYDLALRSVEQIEPNEIHHIPRVLYHWRVHGESTAQTSAAKPYAMLAGERALNEHFQRQGVNAKAELIGHGYRVRYALPDSPPLVTLIIPTRNSLPLIRQCVESILQKTLYPKYEILIVDNGSDDPKTLRYFESLKTESRVRVLRDDRPFNFSALNNAAVKSARGYLVGLVNNDISVMSPEWLSEMVSLALQPKIGAVGARLWFPNDTLQHGGIVLGIAGWAGHSHKGFPRGCLGNSGRMSLISQFSAVTGACLIIEKATYEKVGGLNETDFQVACNDVDFCLRVREAGYRNVWTPYAELYHHESATRGYEDQPQKQSRFAKEVELMKQRWDDLFSNDPAYSPNLTLDYEDFSLAWPPRVGSYPPLSRFDKAMCMVNKNGLGLEMGQSHIPLALKIKGYNVHILGSGSVEELRTKPPGDGINNEDGEAVDFVWHGESLRELFGYEQCYDWIVASHTIEYTPDLISFLIECEALLKSSGVLSLIIPDKRYGFDNYRGTTSTGELLDAYEQKRKRPSPGKIFDYSGEAAKRNKQISKEPDTAGVLEGVHEMSESRRHWQQAQTTQEYIGVLNWRFTPSSFRLLLKDLRALGLTSLEIKMEFDTADSEFFVTLGKNPDLVPLDRTDRVKLVERLTEDEESISQSFQ